MTYQSFDGRPADSDSHGKLAALQLPPLAGKSFLDLGCNEAFFCGEALRRQARRVVGIDAVPTIIDKARARFPDAEFLCRSWWELPDEPFDVILMASALHYERNPLGLCRKILSRLAPGGVFVLECGVVPEWVNPVWIEVQRWDCTPAYPSLKLLRDYILQDFAVRHLGKSVDPPGDPVARHVFHCHAYEPMVLLVWGATGAGKSVLATELGKGGVPIVDTDQIFVEVAKQTTRHTGGVFDLIHREYHAHLRSSLYDRIAADNGHCAELARYVVSFLAEYSRLTVLEGAILENPRFRAAVRDALVARGFRVWNVLGQDGDARAIAGPSATADGDGYIGNVDGVFTVGTDQNEHTVAGWCMRKNVSAPCGVVLEVDGVRFGPYLADTFRPDLKQAGIGSGAHGFVIHLGTVPHADGSIVRVYSADGKTELAGGGCSIKALHARLIGR